jgi:hypothetical protein
MQLYDFKLLPDHYNARPMPKTKIYCPLVDVLPLVPGPVEVLEQMLHFQAMKFYNYNLFTNKKFIKGYLKRVK